jgi:hypothetical protein
MKPLASLFMATKATAVTGRTQQRNKTLFLILLDLKKMFIFAPSTIIYGYFMMVVLMMVVFNDGCLLP